MSGTQLSNGKTIIRSYRRRRKKGRNAVAKLTTLERKALIEAFCSENCVENHPFVEPTAEEIKGMAIRELRTRWWWQKKERR